MSSAALVLVSNVFRATISATTLASQCLSYVPHTANKQVNVCLAFPNISSKMECASTQESLTATALDIKTLFARNAKHHIT